MTHAPYSYAEVLSCKNELVAEMSSIAESIETAIERIKTAQARLGRLAEPAPVGFIDTVNFVNAQVTASPSDPEWLREQAELGKIVNNFIAKATYVAALIAAIEAV